jgi:protoheme IX farnesyltransferase
MTKSISTSEAKATCSLFKTYYSLTKPGIIYGNAMTAIAGYLFGSQWHIEWDIFLAFLLGNILIIASACVFNNYIDRGIDAKMSRTKKRATATGKISPIAVNIYAAALGTAGFIILTKTNTITFLIGLAAFFSYVVLYGAAKRKTIHGTLVGTLPGSASLVAGYTAATRCCFS